MSKVSALRKLIREELVHVLRQELPRLLQEGKAVPQYKESLKRQMESKIPETLNKPTAPKINAPKIGNSILDSILAETAHTMTQVDAAAYGDTSISGYDDLQEHFGGPGVVNSVTDMLSNSMGSTSHEAVHINAVPDFSALMDKMMSKGEI
jgi:hypothetical protein